MNNQLLYKPIQIFLFFFVFSRIVSGYWLLFSLEYPLSVRPLALLALNSLNISTMYTKYIYIYKHIQYMYTLLWIKSQWRSLGKTWLWHPFYAALKIWINIDILLWFQQNIFSFLTMRRWNKLRSGRRATSWAIPHMKTVTFHFSLLPPETNTIQMSVFKRQKKR